MNCSPFAKDRDLVLEQQIINVGPLKRIYIQQSIQRDDLPVKNDAIRIDMFDAAVCEQQDSGIKSTEFYCMDLKGYFPTGLMNITLNSITKYWLKTDYQNLLEKQQEMDENNRTDVNK